MYHQSEFSPEVSEYLFQQIEEIKQYVSPEGLFLLEETFSSKNNVKIILKVKDRDCLFQVESTAENIYLAAAGAKQKVIDLILRQRSQQKAMKIYNS